MAHTSDRAYRAHRARIARTNPVCSECGKPIDATKPQYHPESLELDHIIPYSKGGTNAPNNLTATHRRCNRAKSANPHAPTRDERRFRHW